MGIQEEHDEVIGGKGEQQVKAMKSQAEEMVEFYKKLKSQNDSHKRSIVGLTTEKEEVRKRIRALLHKRQAAEGPDYDEYQITRKISKQYEPIDSSRRRSTVKKVGSIDVEITPGEPLHEEDQENLAPVSITVTVKATELDEE